MTTEPLRKKKDAIDPQLIAIVIGIGSYNDIGLIRSCGENHIKSIYLIHEESIIIPINKSKYLLKTEYINIENIQNTLIKIQSEFPSSKFIIFPASDVAVVAMDEIAAFLPECFRTSHANGNISQLMDKMIMKKMAMEAGLPSPETQILNLNEDTKYEINFPIILKPLKSIAGNKSDITICQNYKDFTRAVVLLKEKGYDEILYQKYLHNSNSKEIGITGVSYPDGTIEIHGYIDKIRNRANINNYGKYYPNDESSILPQLKKYIKSTGYVGIFDTDFILFDRQLYFIECNFRNGAYGYCVTKAGFNMPYQLSVSFFGNGIVKIENLHNITFMEERTDILNVIDHSIPFFKWIKDFLYTDTLLWWNWKDPAPMLRIPLAIKQNLRFFKPKN